MSAVVSTRYVPNDTPGSEHAAVIVYDDGSVLLVRGRRAFAFISHADARRVARLLLRAVPARPRKAKT